MNKFKKWVLSTSKPWRQLTGVQKLQVSLYVLVTYVPFAVYAVTSLLPLWVGILVIPQMLVMMFLPMKWEREYGRSTKQE